MLSLLEAQNVNAGQSISQNKAQLKDYFI